jgi:hypothetical protein
VTDTATEIAHTLKTSHQNKPRPLWFHDIDRCSLAIARNRALLHDWMREITRDEILAQLFERNSEDQFPLTQIKSPRQPKSRRK